MSGTFLSSKQTSVYNVRSISLPSRSHPNTTRIEQELKKLAYLNSSSSSNPGPETISAALSGLTNLYKHVADLFNLPANQQALAHHPQHRTLMVTEPLDGSVTFLDICGNTRDTLLLIKQTARELQSALRRKKGGDNWSIESYISTYISSRKKTTKEIAKSLASLKQLENMTPVLILHLNDHLSAIVKVVREATLVTGSIFRSLLWFLSAPACRPKSAARRWSLILKVVGKRVGAGSENHGAEMVKNELESVDVEVGKLLMVKNEEEEEEEDDEAEKMEAALLTRLEGVDIMIEDFEKRLECLFRQMIQARVSLLNILST